MLLVEGFHGTGPICGILTTCEDWMVAWLPTDDAHFQSIPSLPQETVHLYSTPHKIIDKKKQPQSTRRHSFAMPTKCSLTMLIHQTIETRKEKSNEFFNKIR